MTGAGVVEQGCQMTVHPRFHVFERLHRLRSVARQHVESDLRIKEVGRQLAGTRAG